MQIKVSICTVFPEVYTNLFQCGIVARACNAGLIKVLQYKFADFSEPKKKIDKPICGHGSGMVIEPLTVSSAIEKARAISGPGLTIFFSPHGKKLDQKLLESFVEKFLSHQIGHLIFVAGRYEGIDARVEESYADEIISIGDYVLMDGDLPTMVFLEAFLRLVPGVIGNISSVKNDSFSKALLDYPHFCLPAVWNNKEVPAVLLSGDHKKVDLWRKQKAFERTMEYNSDWFFQSPAISQDEKELFFKTIPGHYIVLMHDQVLIGPEKKVGATSVTSIDIHDIARSAKTYGILGFFIVTPLIDQQEIVKEFLNFWRSDKGNKYNQTRQAALDIVDICDSLEDVIKRIDEREKKLPVRIATSARIFDATFIDFHDRHKVWHHNRPVLFILGTGQGLQESIIKEADFVLLPILGLTDYNHLSVRSAAAIIFDRWFGLNTRL